MAKLGISTGSAPNDGTGDSLIDGAIKVNSNFNEIYTAIGDGTTLAVPVTNVVGGTGINVSGSTGNVTITNTGIANTNNLRTDFLEVSGISTLSGGVAVTGVVTATSFSGSGANITGISTLNIVNYSGGGGGGSGGGIALTDLSVTQNSVGISTLSYNNSNGVFSYTPPDLSSYLTSESDTLADVTSRGAVSSQTITFGSGRGIEMETASNNDFHIYGSSNQKAYITHNQNNLAGGAGDLVVIAKNGLHVYGGTSETTANLGLEVKGGLTNLLYNGGLKLATNNTGITVNGDINGTNLETGTGYLTLGNLSSTFDIRFSPASGSSPSIRYNISEGISIYNRYNGGADLLEDVRFGASQTFVKHITPFSDSTYNLGTNTSRWASVWSDNLNVGAGTSTGVTNTPSLILSHNNPTVVGTSGTTGQVKQIGGQPYYYDGTTWRALFLSEAPLTVNQADSDWDNTMIRMNFDQANIGAVTNLKDGRTPAATNVDLVASPLKYGTKTARLQSGNTGLSFTQNNSGSVYYPFEGAWTLEGWFYFDSGALPNETVITNSHALFSNLHTTTGVSNNWRIGFYHGGSTLYNFYWSNKNSSATGNNGAGNSNTGFLLDQRANSTFADNAWHHIAIVREPGNGSIHYYFDGTESTRTSSDQLIDNQISDQTTHSFYVGYYGLAGDSGQFQGNIDDIRVSKSARYTANFTPPAAALPITGSTTTVYEPADSKVGEISLGGSPAWTGTPGVTASQIAAGQYRATFATAYSNATDYVIQTSMNDYTPATTPVGIGVSRFTTHADFFVKRVSDGANIDTGSLAIDLFKK